MLNKIKSNTFIQQGHIKLVTVKTLMLQKISISNKRCRPCFYRKFLKKFSEVSIKILSSATVSNIDNKSVNCDTEDWIMANENSAFNYIKIHNCYVKVIKFHSFFCLMFFFNQCQPILVLILIIKCKNKGNEHACLD